jgi:hypothetical protein
MVGQKPAAVVRDQHNIFLVYAANLWTKMPGSIFSLAP